MRSAAKKQRRFATNSQEPSLVCNDKAKTPHKKTKGGLLSRVPQGVDLVHVLHMHSAHVHLHDAATESLNRILTPPPSHPLSVDFGGQDLNSTTQQI